MNRDKVMTFVKKSLSFLPDKSYIKLYYQLRVGRKLNTNNPTTLNEKLQWLKFNYRFPLQSIVSDKLLVRDYVKEKIGEEYLIPLLGSWEKYEDIDFSLLPKQFVLKCNHDSGGLVVCTDKNKLDHSGMFDLMVGGEVQADVVNHIQHYRESPLVQKAISDIKTLLEKRQASKELEERPNTRQSVREALKNRKKAQEQQSNQEQAKPKKAKKKGEMEL